MHEVCASLLVALEPRSEARSSINRCAQSFHFNHCKIEIKKLDQSANKAHTRHSHQIENCNSGKMFGKSL
jgi:cellobiose-specific phosphotransferase system component IIA